MISITMKIVYYHFHLTMRKYKWNHKWLIKYCRCNTASPRTWSLLIFPVVVTGNGIFHTMNFFGILNLQKIDNEHVNHHTCIWNCGIWLAQNHRFQETITQSNSFLYSISKEPHWKCEAYSLQLSLWYLHAPIASFLLSEHKPRPFQLDERLEFQQQQRRKLLDVVWGFSLPVSLNNFHCIRIW